MTFLLLAPQVRCGPLSNLPFFILVAADRTPASDFKPDYSDIKPCSGRDLALELLKQGTAVFLNLAALQACEVNVILLGSDLVVVLFPIQMHEIEFVNESQPLQLLDGPVHGGAVDTWLSLSSQREQ